MLKCSEEFFVAVCYLLWIAFFLLHQASVINFYVSFFEFSVALVCLFFACFLLRRLLLKFTHADKVFKAVFLLLFTILFYAPIYDFTLSVWPFLRHRYLILIILFLSTCIVYINKKFNSRLLVIISVILLLYETSNITSKVDQIKEWKTHITTDDKMPLFDCKSEVLKSNQHNIYLLVFDAYMNPEVYKEVYRQDDDLLTFLSSVGFDSYLNSKSSSNNTIFSMLSFFNKTPFDQSTIKDPINQNTICRALLNNSLLVKELTNQGYSIENFSFFDISNQSAFREFDGLMVHGLSFFRLIFQRSIFGKLYFDLYHNYIGYQVHKHTADALLKTIRPNTSQWFYAHFLLPHRPYTFKSNGQVWQTEQENRSEAVLYQHQIQYTRLFIREFIENILQKDSLAEIMLISDHGPKDFELYENQKSYYNLASIKNAQSTGKIDSSKLMLFHELSSVLSISQ